MPFPYAVSPINHPFGVYTLYTLLIVTVLSASLWLNVTVARVSLALLFVFVGRL